MNLGMGELLVLALVALVIFGPERLPGIARQVGKAMRTFQHETSRAAAELQAAADVRIDDGDAGVLDRPPSPAAATVGVAPPALSAPAAIRRDGEPAALEDT